MKQIKLNIISAMRPTWTGSLSFGLVNIPIRLYTATDSKSLDLTMLHKKDLSPIRYAKVCKAEGVEITMEQIVKGYEFEKGDFIVLTDEDFAKANVKRTSTIEIVEFVDQAEVDSIYFEKPFYLEPDKAEKAYVLLREALKKSKKAAISKFVLRNREHLGLIRPEGDLLVLNQMRFEREIREPKGLNIPKAEVENKEIEMALTLIDHLSGHFEPKKFKDTYHQELERVIEEKSKGKTPKAKGEVPSPTPVPDLLATLRASLERSRTGAAPPS